MLSARRIPLARGKLQMEYLLPILLLTTTSPPHLLNMKNIKWFLRGYFTIFFISNTRDSNVFGTKGILYYSIATGYAERPSYSAGSYKIVQSVDVSTNLCRALYAILFV